MTPSSQSLQPSSLQGRSTSGHLAGFCLRDVSAMAPLCPTRGQTAMAKCHPQRPLDAMASHYKMIQRMPWCTQLPLWGPPPWTIAGGGRPLLFFMLPWDSYTQCMNRNLQWEPQYKKISVLSFLLQEKWIDLSNLQAIFCRLYILLLFVSQFFSLIMISLPLRKTLTPVQFWLILWHHLKTS